MRALKLVPASPDTRLHDLIIERDKAARVLARLDALIVEEGRARWRARGMWGTPTLGQMRNEVGL